MEEEQEQEVGYVRSNSGRKSSVDSGLSISADLQLFLLRRSTSRDL